jgi:hypothetical protein
VCLQARFPVAHRLSLDLGEHCIDRLAFGGAFRRLALCVLQ